MNEVTKSEGKRFTAPTVCGPGAIGDVVVNWVSPMQPCSQPRRNYNMPMPEYENMRGMVSLWACSLR